MNYNKNMRHKEELVVKDGKIIHQLLLRIKMKEKLES